MTDLADEEGRRCYLESSRDEPNVKIYERMGFQMVKEMECDDDGEVCKVGVVDDEGSLNIVGRRLIGLQLFCMIREPQPTKHDLR